MRSSWPAGPLSTKALPGTKSNSAAATSAERSRKRVALSVVVMDCGPCSGVKRALAETAVRERHSRPGASPHAARRVTAEKQPRMLASKCNRDSSIRSPLARALPPRSCQKACHGLHGMKNGKIIGTA